MAEVLSKYYDVDVYNKKKYRNINLIKNDSNKVKLHVLFRLPFQRVMKEINTRLIKLQLGWVIDKYDYVWIANANDYCLIRDKVKRQVIIYDCMDDIIEFPHRKKNKNAIKKFMDDEYELIQDCDFVFVSADHLKDVLRKRYPDINSDKMFVVNNAITHNLLDVINHEVIINKKGDNKVITYIGTISQWMDWEIVVNSLGNFKNIEYHFYGPKEVDIPNHERIIYKGIIPQQEIFSVMKNSDLLIMPFIVNDLILSVNPVKLYEYILSGVPALACGYAETDKFSDYVYLYHDKDEYMDIIKKLSNGDLKVKSKEGYDFVKRNTWENRAETIVNIIGGR